MASYGYGGHILMLPEEEKEKHEYDDEMYPFSVPKVILEGFCEQYMPPKEIYSWSADSVVTVRGNVVTKFIKTEFTEQLVKDEKGNTVWFDSRKVPFDGTWQCKFLGETRDAEEYTVEEIDLENMVKKTYKVTLQETTPLEDWDIRRAEQYQKIKKKNIVGDFVLDEDKLVAYKGNSAEIVLPDGITRIGDSAFSGCSALQSITIPDSVTEIGYAAFYGCAALQNITVPRSVTNIRDNAFDGCTALQSIIIPDSVTAIGSGAFYGCIALQSITIPDSVKMIRDGLFCGCTALKSLTLPSGVEIIGSHAFGDCTSLQSITIPAGVNYIEGSLFSGTTDVQEIIIDPKNRAYYAENNCIIEKGTNVLISGSNRSVLPDGITSIGKYAFSGCSGLKSITIPDSVTSIRNSAFGGCTSLTSIIVPDGVAVIEDMVFSHCTSLIRITIPNSVTEIEHGALYGCSSLAKIIFQGTKSQWEAIKKDKSWNYGTGNYEVHFEEKDGDDGLPF